MVAGELDFSTTLGAATAAIMRGSSLKRVFYVQHDPNFALTAQPEIKTIRELIGKVIGVNAPTDAMGMSAKMILKGNGIDPSQVTFLSTQVTENAYKALLSKRVAANGDLYVVWFDCNFGIRQIVRKSRDGGKSFDDPVAAASGLTAPPNQLIGSSFRVNAAFPAIASDPTDENRVYVTWSSDNGASQTDVFVSHSLNGGVTWSAPVRVNDDPPGNPHDQFFPWIAVDTDGTVRVIWGDDRLDLANPGGKFYDIFMATSTDYGATFGPNIRVTSESSNPDLDGFDGTFIGDYFGLSASGVAVWADTRNWNQDIFGGPFLPEVLNVVIDIRPKSDANRINPNSSKDIRVAILSVNGFDANTVDPNTVRFGATGTEAAPIHIARRDVDGDGDRDIVLRFRIQDTGIKCGDTSAILTGQISNGPSIIGSSLIRTVQCFK
jgi:hypothetical protein